MFLGTVGGTNVTANFGGLGIVNYATTNCTIWGLTNCTSIKLSGAADLVARIYAPQADVVIRGGAQAYGAFTVKSFSLSGSSGIHLDEALAK
jgi:choice-of-anchor A domain-containing protein